MIALFTEGAVCGGEGEGESRRRRLRGVILLSGVVTVVLPATILGVAMGDGTPTVRPRDRKCFIE